MFFLSTHPAVKNGRHSYFILTLILKAGMNQINYHPNVFSPACVTQASVWKANLANWFKAEAVCVF